MKGRIRIVLALLFCSFFVSLHLPFHSHLTPSEERGKLIYTQGIRTSGIPIKAKLSGATFNARILPCVNCHGTNGIGNPEGGVVPSPLDWSIMTKPYAIKFKNGRKRDAYTETLFKTALETGIDPSQNQLDPVMPYYFMDKEDIEDLIAYLKVIGDENPSGISENEIRIGVILSANAIEKNKAYAVVKTMKAYLDLINESGGIFNRRIRLIELHLTEGSPDNEKHIQDFFNQHSLFALIGSKIDNLSFDNMELIASYDVPIIGAISSHPTFTKYIQNDFYYLLPGPKEKLKSLYDFAQKELGKGAKDILILHDENYTSEWLQQWLQDMKLNLHKDLIINIKEVNSKLYMQRLKDSQISTCVYLGDAENGYKFFASAKDMAWYPNILTIDENINDEWNKLPIKDVNNLHVVFQNWVSEQNEFAIQKFEKMSSYYSLDSDFKTDQYLHLSSVILFSEVLKLTGKKVTTQGFIERLHEEQKFMTGFIPPLSFSANKRIGSEKTFIASIEFENRKFRLIY